MIAFLRNLIVPDFYLKLFSFVLAVLTWFAVNSMANPKEGSPVAALSLAPSERVVFSNLPVIVLSSAGDVRDFRVEPKEIEATVQGDSRTLRALQGRDIQVQVDLRGIGAAHDFRKRIEVQTPAGVTVVRVVPEEVQVTFPGKN